MEDNRTVDAEQDAEVEAEVSDEAGVDVEREVDIQTGGVNIEREVERDEAEKPEG